MSERKTCNSIIECAHKKFKDRDKVQEPKDIEIIVEVKILIKGKIRQGNLVCTEKSLELMGFDKIEKKKIDEPDYEKLLIEEGIVKKGFFKKTKIDVVSVSYDNISFEIIETGQIRDTVLGMKEEFVLNKKMKQDRQNEIKRREERLLNVRKDINRNAQLISGNREIYTNFIENPYRVLNCSLCGTGMKIPSTKRLYEAYLCLHDRYWEYEKEWDFLGVESPEITYKNIENARSTVLENSYWNLFWFDNKMYFRNWNLLNLPEMYVYDDALALYFRILTKCINANDLSVFCKIIKKTIEMNELDIRKFIGKHIRDEVSLKKEKKQLLQFIIRPLIVKSLYDENDIMVYVEALKQSRLLDVKWVNSQVINTYIEEAERIGREIIDSNRGVKEYSIINHSLVVVMDNISSWQKLICYMERQVQWICNQNRTNYKEYADVIYYLKPNYTGTVTYWRRHYKLGPGPLVEDYSDYQLEEMAKETGEKKYYQYVYDRHIDKAQKGDTDAAFLIAKYHEKGYLGVKDMGLAEKYYRIAIRGGNCVAMNNLAVLLENRQYLNQMDKEEIEKLYKNAMKSESGIIYYNYAMFMWKYNEQSYSLKILVRDYMQKALEKGYEDANIFLKKYGFVSKTEEDIGTIYFNDVVISSSSVQCTNKGHRIVSLKAMIYKIKKDGSIISVIVPAAYCYDCNHYFILKKDVETISLDGHLLCQFETFEKEINVNSRIGEGWNEESILRKCGYNVNQKENLTEKQREIILTYIMESKILSPTEICSLIDSFIDLREGNSSMKLAISKWRHDRHFVSTYKFAKRKLVAVKY